MKKLFFLFTLATLVLFTSCDKESNDEAKQSFTATINSRAIDGNDVVFAQGNIQVEVNLTHSTIVFSGDFKDANGRDRSLKSPSMSLDRVTSYVYKFMSDVSNEFSNLYGYIDLGTGMMWYSFNLDDGTTVISTTQLLYPYATTLITDEKGNPYEHQQSAYLFALDSKGETGYFQVTNFIPNTNGVVQASVIQYNGLNVTPTTTGYVITADELEPSTGSHYTITDLDFTLDEQCHSISGTFKANGHTFEVTGPLFINK